MEVFAYVLISVGVIMFIAQIALIAYSIFEGVSPKKKSKKRSKK